MDSPPHAVRAVFNINGALGNIFVGVTHNLLFALTSPSIPNILTTLGSMSVSVSKLGIEKVCYTGVNTLGSTLGREVFSTGTPFLFSRPPQLAELQSLLLLW